MSKEHLYDITEVCGMMGTTSRTLRFYEEKGIIKSTSSPNTGYLVSGHCGIAAYMMLTAMYVLNKKNYTITQFLLG